MNFTHLMIAAVVTVGLQPAWAARPLATDDAGVIASGGCEFEASRVVARHGTDRTGETAAALACGMAFGAQLGLGYGRARGPEGRADGLALSAKAELWTGAGATAPALALAGALGWGRTAGQDWQRESSEVRLIGTLPVVHAFVHVNLGHARSHTGGPKATTWGLALEHQPATLAGLGWAPLAEVYGDDRGDRWVNVGVRTTVLPDRLFVDLAYARQQAPEKARVWNAGLRFAF
jgi:hypothetical protein